VHVVCEPVFQWQMGVCPSCLQEDRNIHQDTNRDRCESIPRKEGTTPQKQTVAADIPKETNIPNVSSKEKIGFLNLDSKSKHYKFDVL